MILFHFRMHHELGAPCGHLVYYYEYFHDLMRISFLILSCFVTKTISHLQKLVVT